MEAGNKRGVFNNAINGVKKFYTNQTGNEVKEFTKKGKDEKAILNIKLSDSVAVSKRKNPDDQELGSWKRK